MKAGTKYAPALCLMTLNVGYGTMSRLITLQTGGCPRVFEGVRSNLKALKEEQTVREQVQTSLELPFSAIADTVFLPSDLLSIFDKRKFGFCGLIRDWSQQTSDQICPKSLEI